MRVKKRPVRDVNNSSAESLNDFLLSEAKLNFDGYYSTWIVGASFAASPADAKLSNLMWDVMNASLSQLETPLNIPLDLQNIDPDIMPSALRTATSKVEIWDGIFTCAHSASRYCFRRRLRACVRLSVCLSAQNLENY